MCKPTPYEVALREWSFPDYIRERNELMREAYASGLSYRRIARAVGMSAPQVFRIITGARS